MRPHSVLHAWKMNSRKWEYIDIMNFAIGAIGVIGFIAFIISFITGLLGL